MINHPYNTFPEAYAERCRLADDNLDAYLYVVERHHEFFIRRLRTELWTRTYKGNKHGK